jgi:outer membrane protein assembly factor BamB
LITDEEQAMGSAGAGVWSTPTYDADLKLVFVTTGNNYTVHATETSDAFVALEAATGHEKWHFQAHPNDKGQIEADIGDSPQVYTLLSGKKVVGAGQKKTGIYWVLDASTGALVNNIRAVPNCKDSLGLFADSAIMGDVVFVNGVNCKLPTNPPSIPPAGVVIALNKDASGKVWEFPSTTPQIGSALSGVAVANGVVYFHDSGLSSNLYALKALTGDLLAQTPYHVKVFLSRDPLSIVRAKPQSLVQRFGCRIVHLDQEGDTMVPELAGSIAPRFDQFATIAFALATRTHAEGIQVKLRRFRFRGDRIVGIT